MSLFLTFLLISNPTVDRIEVTGNKITKENVVRREIPFAPGDSLTPELVGLTRKAVMSVGAFANVQVNFDSSAVSTDVEVSVTEFTFPLPYPTIGIDASSGWYIGGGVLYPNLLGQGLQIDAGGDIGFKVKTTPRYTLYTNLQFPVTYNRWHGEKIGYRYFEVWRKDAAITRRENRAFYKQSVRPWRPLTFFLEGGWLRIKSFAPDTICDIPTFCTDTVDASLYFQPGFILDYRDDVLFPTKGVLVVGAFTYNPGLKEDYQTQMACSLSVAGYYPIGKTVIAGNIWTYQQLDSIPVYNTLYLGNARIVRGWADTSQVDQCLTVASLELRRYFWSVDLPVIGEFKVGGNLFFDIGAAHEPGLPPLHLAKTTEDTHDGLLTGTGFGLTLEAIGFVVKGEIAWGIGAEEGALAFIPLPIRYPVYFGWRF